jgi:hypothetical protein
LCFKAFVKILVAIAFPKPSAYSSIKKEHLIAQNINFETRTTCDPRLLSINDIYTIANQLKERGVDNYHLQKYRPIPSDKESTDEMCNKFFKDKELITYLKQSFKIFDTRE